MNIQQVMSYVESYGLIVVLVLAFIEYLCIPGYPGGLVVPAVGVLAALDGMNPFLGFTAALLAGCLGCTVAFFISKFFGKSVQRFIQKHKMLKKSFDMGNRFLEKYGLKGLAAARIIPIIRTFVSIPAGILQMKFWPYLIWSTVGNAVYCALMILLGFFATSLFI